MARLQWLRASVATWWLWCVSDYVTGKRAMDSARKFAAHRRGSARTLVLVGTRPSAATTPVVPANGRYTGEPGDFRVPRVGMRPGEGGDGSTLVLRAGQKVFGRGEGHGRLFLVRSGCVALFKPLTGRRAVCVGLLGPGDVFAQEPAAGSAQPSAIPLGVVAEVLADTTLTVFASDDLPRIFATAPALAVDITQGLTRRVAGMQILVGQLLARDLTIRLASVLLTLADRFGGPEEDDRERGVVAIDIPMPHKLLARIIGANRVTVTRVLGEFRAAGLVEGRGRNHLAVNPDGLREYLARARPAG